MPESVPKYFYLVAKIYRTKDEATIEAMPNLLYDVDRECLTDIVTVHLPPLGFTLP